MTENNLEIMLVSRLAKKRGLSINPDIHHSKVPSSGFMIINFNLNIYSKIWGFLNLLSVIWNQNNKPSIPKYGGF